MPIMDMECLDCKRVTVLLQRYEGNIDEKHVFCGHCNSKSLNLVAYYESEITKIKELEKEINDLQSRIEELDASYGDDRDDLPKADYLWH